MGTVSSLAGKSVRRALGATPAPVSPTPAVGAKQLVRTGLGAGAGLLALSALSAAASAARRRER